MKRRVLVVEDDRSLAKVLTTKLSIEGFDVSCANDGRTALAQARTFVPDIIVLDVTLPDISGFELCRGWHGKRTPIVMLTARGDKADKLQGLESGADDYITKPFDMQELLARIHAVLRRARPTLTRLRLGTVSIDFETSTALNDADVAIELTPREFGMLRDLAERPGTIVHRDELLQAFWGSTETAPTRAVDQAILRLRRKIESDVRQPRFIHTAHGDGYYLTPDGGGRAEGDPSQPAV